MSQVQMDPENNSCCKNSSFSSSSGWTGVGWMVYGHRAVACVRSTGDFQSIRGWVSGSVRHESDSAVQPLPKLPSQSCFPFNREGAGNTKILTKKWNSRNKVGQQIKKEHAYKASYHFAHGLHANRDFCLSGSQFLVMP